MITPDVAALVERDAELLEPRTLLRSDEAHRQEHEVGSKLAIGALDLLETTIHHFDFVQQQAAHMAVAVVEEAFGVDAEHPITTLLVGGRHAVHEVPLRPRVVLGATVGWARHDLELRHAGRTLTVNRAEAIGAGVAAADDDHPLAMDVDGRRVDVAFLHPVGQRQVLHRLMNSGQLSPRDRQIARRSGTAGQHDRVVRREQHFDVDAVTDWRPRSELGAFGLHLGDATLQMTLLHLELWNAVAQQSADAVRSLQDDRLVTGARQLLRGRETCWARTDYDDALAGLHARQLRLDPSFVPRPVDDLHLDLLDRDGIGVDAEDTRRFTWRRAQPPRELGKVVGRVQPIDRLTPVLAIDEVVPVGDQVAERTTVVAERDAAVHASAGLRLDLVEREVVVDLFPIEQAHWHVAPRRHLPSPLQKPSDLTHARPPSLGRESVARRDHRPPLVSSRRALGRSRPA